MCALQFWVHHRLWSLLSLTIVGFWISPNPACAQTVKQTAALALEHNPSIRAERMRLSGLTELQIQASNLRRPSVQAELSTGLTKSGQRFDGAYAWEDVQPSNASITATQPLMLGGRYLAAAREADIRIAQGIARVRSLQLTTIRNTLEAYADVIRDWATLTIRDEGLSNLLEQLEATQARKDVGLIGLTDLAQAQTRVAAARGQQASARARLLGSWATLERLIGSKPTGLLEHGFQFSSVPPDLQAAIEIGLRNSHDLRIARFNEEIARASAKRISAEGGPTASLNASLSATNTDGFQGANSADFQVNARFSLPLWSGGQSQSRTRAALAEANASRIDALDVEQQLVERVTIAWANYEASIRNVEAANEQVRAARIAREGTELEQRLGARSTLEVLNQEQELLEARVDAAVANREFMVSTSLLLTLIGTDPTGIINSETEFSLERNPLSLLDPPNGKPALIERPFIALHDRLLPLDAAIGDALQDFKHWIGPEQ